MKSTSAVSSTNRCLFGKSPMKSSDGNNNQSMNMKSPESATKLNPNIFIREFPRSSPKNLNSNFESGNNKQLLSKDSPIFKDKNLMSFISKKRLKDE